MSAEPTIPAGMVRWRGGDSAPEDWDGGRTLHRDHGMVDFAMPEEWQDGRIIAYTPRSTPTAEGEASREAVARKLYAWMPCVLEASLDPADLGCVTLATWEQVADNVRDDYLAKADAILALSAHNETDKLREALGKAIVFSAYNRHDPLVIRFAFGNEADRLAAANAWDAGEKA